MDGTAKMKKKSRVVVTGTHPVTLETYHLRVGAAAAQHVFQAFIDMGFWGVMWSLEDYFDSPKFEDPWTALRARGVVHDAIA